MLYVMTWCGHDEAAVYCLLKGVDLSFRAIGATYLFQSNHQMQCNDVLTEDSCGLAGRMRRHNWQTTTTLRIIVSRIIHTTQNNVKCRRRRCRNWVSHHGPTFTRDCVQLIISGEGRCARCLPNCPSDLVAADEQDFRDYTVGGKTARPRDRRMKRED